MISYLHWNSLPFFSLQTICKCTVEYSDISHCQQPQPPEDCQDMLIRSNNISASEAICFQRLSNGSSFPYFIDLFHFFLFFLSFLFFFNWKLFYSSSIVSSFPLTTIKMMMPFRKWKFCYSERNKRKLILFMPIFVLGTVIPHLFVCLIHVQWKPLNVITG